VLITAAGRTHFSLDAQGAALHVSSLPQVLVQETRELSSHPAGQGVGSTATASGFLPHTAPGAACTSLEKRRKAKTVKTKTNKLFKLNLLITEFIISKLTTFESFTGYKLSLEIMATVIAPGLSNGIGGGHKLHKSYPGQLPAQKASALTPSKGKIKDMSVWSLS
jgi:hypothetical protein